MVNRIKKFLNGKIVFVVMRGDGNIPPTKEGFEHIRDKYCKLKLPTGAQMAGWPREMKEDDFILFECEDGDIIAVEYGIGAELHLLEY